MELSFLFIHLSVPFVHNNRLCSNAMLTYCVLCTVHSSGVVQYGFLVVSNTQPFLLYFIILKMVTIHKCNEDLLKDTQNPVCLIFNIKYLLRCCFELKIGLFQM